MGKLGHGLPFISLIGHILRAYPEPDEDSAKQSSRRVQVIRIGSK